MRTLIPDATITDYSSRDLRAVVRWLKSDCRLYTEDDLLTEVVTELGFRRRGSRIVDAVGRAIAAERESEVRGRHSAETRVRPPRANLHGGP